MKVLILLALVGVILVAIPPPAEGLKCVHCGVGYKPCKDYKKDDPEFDRECQAQKPVCMSSTNVNACNFETSATMPGPCGARAGACFCNDKDLCNGNVPGKLKGGSTGGKVGGSWAGILVISLGLGVILLFRQLVH